MSIKFASNNISSNEFVNDFISPHYQEKYGKKLESVYDELICQFVQLKFDGKWKIYRTVEDFTASLNKWSKINIPDSSKGYFDLNNNIIGISNWAFFPGNELDLYEIVIHELLHARGYNHGDEMWEAIERIEKSLSRTNLRFRIIYGLEEYRKSIKRSIR